VKTKSNIAHRRWKVVLLIAAIAVIASLPATLAWYNQQIIVEGAEIQAADFQITEVMAVPYPFEKDGDVLYTTVTITAEGDVSKGYFLLNLGGSKPYFTPTLYPNEDLTEDSESGKNVYQVSYDLDGNYSWLDKDDVSTGWGEAPAGDDYSISTMIYVPSLTVQTTGAQPEQEAQTTPAPEPTVTPTQEPTETQVPETTQQTTETQTEQETQQATETQTEQSTEPPAPAEPVETPPAAEAGDE